MRSLPLPIPALVLSLLLPPSAAGQSAAPSSQMRAESLLTKAATLVQSADLPKRAELLEEAAKYLPRSDPRTSLVLRSAAEVQHQLQRPRRAMQLFEKAGELAAARGAPVEAADDYVAAMFAALEIPARADARRFIDRAIALTASPAMPEGDRQRILRRLSQPAVEISASYTSILRRMAGQ